MKIWAISDLHLSYMVEKPMNIFGENWDGYEEKILADWNSKVSSGDIGIIAGDISWAMRMSETEKDFEFLKKLNGTKIIIRGNHDYWWSSISKVRSALPSCCIALQNDSVRIGNFVFAGTRGWKVPERNMRPKPDDQKILDREITRLELALIDASKKMQDSDTLITIMHYPPFNSQRMPSPFTDLLKKHGAKYLIYGHLHGKGGRNQLIVQQDGISYFLTSCDILGHEVASII